MWFSIHLKWKHLETFTRSKSSFAYVAKKLPRIVRNGWEKTLQASFPKVPVTCRAWRKIFFVAQFLAPRHLKSGVPPVHRISSDGDNRRSFLGLRHSIQGFFGVWKFGKYFCGRLDLSGGFIANNITANIKQLSVPEKLPGLSRNGFPKLFGSFVKCTSRPDCGSKKERGNYPRGRGSLFEHKKKTTRNKKLIPG